MRNRRIVGIVLALAVAGLTVAATAAAHQQNPARRRQEGSRRRRVPRRVGVVLRLHRWIRPTAEYLGEAFGIYSNLLVRTLVGYNHVAGAAGNKIVPDLATNTGVVSNGGKTYTFQLKPGVKFGPPLNRAITSKDVLYAFQSSARRRWARSTPSTTTTSRA